MVKVLVGTTLMIAPPDFTTVVAWVGIVRLLFAVKVPPLKLIVVGPDEGPASYSRPPTLKFPPRDPSPIFTVMAAAFLNPFPREKLLVTTSDPVPLTVSAMFEVLVAALPDPVPRYK